MRAIAASCRALSGHVLRHGMSRGNLAVYICTSISYFSDTLLGASSHNFRTLLDAPMRLERAREFIIHGIILGTSSFHSRNATRARVLCSPCRVVVFGAEDDALRPLVCARPGQNTRPPAKQYNATTPKPPTDVFGACCRATRCCAQRSHTRTQHACRVFGVRALRPQTAIYRASGK